MLNSSQSAFSSAHSAVFSQFLDSHITASSDLIKCSSATIVITVHTQMMPTEIIVRMVSNRWLL